MHVITGATGSVGRAMVQRLLDEGAEVVAISRDPGRAALPGGARVVAGDPSRPLTLAGALDGARTLFLNPAAIGGAAEELLELAASCAVERVVLLSAVTVEHDAGEDRFADRFKALEAIVEGSGLAWTFLRSADFAGNARIWAPQIQATGVVRGAYGDAATSPIHERDLAAVAALALADAAHAGKTYLLTGSDSLTQRAKVRIIGEALGRDVPWEELPHEQVRAGMVARGVPEEIADRMLGYQADCVANPGPTTATVAQLLGRPALTFADWARENVEMFHG